MKSNGIVTLKPTEARVDTVLKLRHESSTLCVRAPFACTLSDLRRVFPSATSVSIKRKRGKVSAVTGLKDSVAFVEFGDPGSARRSLRTYDSSCGPASLAFPQTVLQAGDAQPGGPGYVCVLVELL